MKELGELHLPVCKDLLLHCNGLESLGDLSGCPRVQRLWVWSNQLRSLRGLGSLAELRELWAQDNRLSGLNGVECLAALQALNVAENPVRTLASLDKLAHLPQLRSLSFKDAHFADCPVAALRSYRGLVAASLPQLRQLDGRAIAPAERDEAVRAVASKSAAFAADAGARLAAFQAQLGELRAGRAAQAQAAAEAHRAMSQALGSLQAAVAAGVAAVRAEAERQGRVRRAAGEEAHVRLRRLQLALRRWEEGRAAQEAGRRAARAVVLRCLELLDRAAGAAAAAVAGMAALTGGRVVAHEVSPHSPEQRAVEAALGQVAAAAPTAPPGRASAWVAAAYKVTALALAAAAASADAAGGAGGPRQWWLVGSRRAVLAAATPGHRSAPGSADGGVVASTSLAALASVLLGLPRTRQEALLGLGPPEAELLREGGVLCAPALCVSELAGDAARAGAARLDVEAGGGAGAAALESVLAAAPEDGSAVWAAADDGTLALWAPSGEWWSGRAEGPVAQPEALAELRLCSGGPLERAAEAVGLTGRGGVTTARLLSAALSEAAAAARAVLVAQTSPGAALQGAAAKPSAAAALAAAEAACEALAQPEEVRRRAADCSEAITREFVLAVAAGRDPDDEAAAAAARAQAHATDAQALAIRREVGSVKRSQDMAVRAAAAAAASV